eukprot:5215111-Amphidinium_carterae.1
MSTTTECGTLNNCRIEVNRNKGGNFDEGCQCRRNASATVKPEKDKQESRSGSLKEGKQTPSCKESPRRRRAMHGLEGNLRTHTSKQRKALKSGHGEAVRNRR